MTKNTHPNTKAWTREEREAFLIAIQPQLRSICTRSADGLKDPSIDVEDLMQEADIIVCRSFDSYDPTNPASFTTYVYKAIVNALISKNREVTSQKRIVVQHQTPYDSGIRPDIEDDFMGADNIPLRNYFEGGNDLEDDYLHKEKLDRLMEVLRESLPDKYYDPLVEYLLYHNKTQKEIAKEIGKSQAMVSHLLTDLSIIVFYMISHDPLFEDDLRSRIRRQKKGGKRHDHNDGARAPEDRTCDT